MNELQSEEKGHRRRQLVEQAINQAMANQWEQAIETNQQIIDELTPDAEAYNRLGKAHSQLGAISKARAAYEAALTIDPINTIAQRNLERLAALKDQTGRRSEDGRHADPTFFIEETGKTVATTIFSDGPKEALASVAAGDMLGMHRDGDTIEVTTGKGERLGVLDGKLSARLIELQEGGNVYAVAAISVTPSRRELRALVREMRQSPQLAGRVSFPPETSAGFRAYIKGGVLREDRIDEEDEDGGDDVDTVINDEEDAGGDALDFAEDLNES